jgi:hypothetical protein
VTRPRFAQYHYPLLSTPDLGLIRFPGPGLGNLLFPIARALIAASKTNGQFVQPTLRQIKIGTFLRNEPDKRIYGNIIRHRNATDWRNWLDARLSPAVSENAPPHSIATAKTILYSGLGSYFHNLHGYQDIISDWIQERAIKRGVVTEPYDLAVHIRLGDFAQNTEGSGGANLRQTKEWYYAAVELAKEHLGNAVTPRYIFSDARDIELREYISQWNAKLDPAHNTISSIMNLSKAQMIISSRSTFSMWGAYLGNSAIIWDRKFDIDKYWVNRLQKDFSL